MLLRLYHKIRCFFLGHNYNGTSWVRTWRYRRGGSRKHSQRHCRMEHQFMCGDCKKLTKWIRASKVDEWEEKNNYGYNNLRARR